MKSHQHADLAIEDLQKIFNPSTLTTEKRASLFMEVKHRLTAMIRSVKDYKTVFSYLNPEECLDLYQSSKDQLIEMLDQEILDLDKMKIISYLPLAAGITIMSRTIHMRDNLTELISACKYEGVALEKLAAILVEIKPQLSSLIVLPEDVLNYYLLFSPEQLLETFATVQKNLNQATKNTFVSSELDLVTTKPSDKNSLLQIFSLIKESKKKEAPLQKNKSLLNYGVNSN